MTTEWNPISTAPVNRAILVRVPHLDYYGNNCVYAAMQVDMGTGRRWMTFGHAIGRDLGPDDWPDVWTEIPTVDDVAPVDAIKDAPDTVVSSPDVADLISRMNWWGAKRKAPRGMDSLPADCQAAAEALAALHTRVKELEEALGKAGAELRAARDSRDFWREAASAVNERAEHFFKETSRVLNDLVGKSQNDGASHD